ncbi:hypothetical protein PanWU01x14_317480, partial [Parasponia andersonii]
QSQRSKSTLSQWSILVNKLSTAWSTTLTAQSNGSNLAQLSELTQSVAANFRRLIQTRSDSDWADFCDNNIFVSSSSSI